jgi:dihydrolipoamide dehydrogenase
MYDLIIIGAGPAGYYAAERAGKAGMSVLLIEKNNLGGVCLNEGCIPSKTILHSSKLFYQSKNSGKYGVTTQNAEINVSVLMARKQKIVETLRNGIAFTLKKFKVELVVGAARIKKVENGVFSVTVGGQDYDGAKLLICTGSEAIKPPIPGIDQDFILTNKEILSVTAIPSKLVVVGGGVIGLELATFFAEAGSVVSVVEMLPQIGGGIDSEIALALKRELEKKGITFHLQSKVVSFGNHTVSFEENDTVKSVETDMVLISVGRKPVTADLGLEAIGLIPENGAIKTDKHGHTKVPGVWAAGDVNGVSMLAHTAYREAQVCVNDMIGKQDEMTYNAIPGVIYTHPEVATVGLSKLEADNKGVAVIEAKLPMGYSGRYLAETDGERGIMKVVLDAGTKQLLGAHMIGGNCSEMIFGAAAMIEQKLTVKDIAHIVFPHPSVSEIIKDTILQLDE